jgi:hypothetical protein
MVCPFEPLVALILDDGLFYQIFPVGSFRMMSETSEKPEAFSTSLYVTDRKAFEECKRLLKLQDRSLSEEIMEFVLRRRDELKGTGSSTESGIESGRRFEELKAQHFQAGQKTDKLQSVLEEKKVYDNYIAKFAKILVKGDESWNEGDYVEVITAFMKHSSDGDWKRAETRFLVSCKESLAHTFLDYLECVRERKKVGQKLLEMRTDPVELARLDELERQEEEQRKKDVETRKQREAEEARKQKEEDESEDPYAEEEEEEAEGFIIDPNRPSKLTIDDDAEEDAEEVAEEPEETTVEKVVPEPSSECRAIVPVPASEGNGV